MDKTCQKCGALNSGSASFCTKCGHDLSAVVVPVGITLVSYFYLYAAAQSIVMLLLYYNLACRMLEGYLPLSVVWGHQLLVLCVNLYIGIYLKKLKRIAFYVYFVMFVLSLCFIGVFLGHINPFLQRIYVVMGLAPRIAEQDMIEIIMIVGLLVGVALNVIMVGYVYTKRRLFSK
jgi:hypothetical protein